ncbi:MAG TPA: DegT/DnrJ/EryC1/StrS family aminotransferase [Candidatus Nanoarchaeia archaeon]|nr:DegT/DnrJ/EryC1/StrS family aminotransferase [Candidatus Nanoarchaeia archaeon]
MKNKKKTEAIKQGIKKIPLSSPFIEEDDIQAVVNVLRTRWLSLGPKLPEFEEKFAKYIGTRYAVAVNSGTSALHLAVKALGIGPGDEVIVTPFSFVASANCVLYEGATPVFVDIEPDTFNIDPKKIEEKITTRTKAIIPVDVFGRPSNKNAIMKIAKKHNLKIIEDSAEALGAEYKGKKVGAFGDCAIFAFYPNKQMTTGEGGVLVTDNKEIYDLCVSYRNQGRGAGGEWHEYVRLGYNYRLSDINCALGISQLAKIEMLLKKRAEVAKEYTNRLKKIKGIKIPFDSTKEFKVSWFVYVIQVDNKEAFMSELTKRGVQCSSYFNPIHLMSFYKEKFGFKPGDFPVCEAVAKTTVALPFYSAMSKEDVAYVCEKIAEVQKKLIGG